MTLKPPEEPIKETTSIASQSLQSNFTVHLLFAIALLFIVAVKYFLYFHSAATEHGFTAGRIGATFGHLLIWGLAYSMCLATQKKVVLGCLAAPTLFFGVLLIPALGYLGLILMGFVFYIAKRNTGAAKQIGKTSTKTKHTQESNESASEQVTWWSEVPAGWPNLTTDPLPSTQGASPQLDTIFFAARFTEATAETEQALKITSIGQTLLTAKGVLDVPLEVDDSGVSRSVFFFPGAGERESGWAEGIRRLFDQHGKPAPAFFAPHALQPADASPPMRALRPSDFNKLEGRPPEGSYSIWWKDSESGSWEDSACVEEITRFYESVDGVESYLVGLTLHSLGVLDQPGRQGLPEGETTLPMVGPEGMPILMSLSAEKGVRFHIREDPNNVDYRNNFWRSAANLAQETRIMVEDQGYPMDEKGDESPLKWWKFNLAALNHLREDGDEIQHIGFFKIS